VPLLLLGPPFVSYYSFLVPHRVKHDDWHLLAHAMASDFTVTCIDDLVIMARRCSLKKIPNGENFTPRDKYYS
jgi:hypothetical protein